MVLAGGVVLYLISLLPRGLLESLRKVHNNPNYILALVKPINIFRPLKREGTGYILDLNGKKYIFFPDKIEFFGKYPFIEVHLEDTFVMPAEVRKELNLILSGLPEPELNKIISKILEYKRKLSLYHTIENPEVKEEIKADLELLEAELKETLDQHAIIEIFDKAEKKSLLVPIDWEKIKGYYLNVNPSTTYYYAEELAFSLLKSLQKDKWFWIIAIITVLIGGAIAWKIIGGG